MPGSWSNQAKTAVDGSSICDDKASCKILAEDEAVSSWGCAYSECYRARGGNQWNCEPDPLKAKVLNRTTYKPTRVPLGCSENCQYEERWGPLGCDYDATSVSSVATTPNGESAISGSGQLLNIGHADITYNNGAGFMLQVGDQFTLSGCGTTALEQVYTVKSGTTAMPPHIVASGTGLGADRTVTETCTLTVIAPRIRCRTEYVGYGATTAPAPDMTDFDALFDADTTTPDMTLGVGYGANTTPSGGVEDSGNFITSMIDGVKKIRL